jgi:hypothetical protein
VLSYAFAGVVCVFSAFSYAEFAARIPLSGSAYTYAPGAPRSCVARVCRVVGVSSIVRVVRTHQVRVHNGGRVSGVDHWLGSHAGVHDWLSCRCSVTLLPLIAMQPPSHGLLLTLCPCYYYAHAPVLYRGWSGYVRGMLTGVGIDYPLYLTHWQVGPCDVDITAALSVVVLTSTAAPLLFVLCLTMADRTPSAVSHHLLWYQGVVPLQRADRGHHGLLHPLHHRPRYV